MNERQESIHRRSYETQELSVKLAEALTLEPLRTARVVAGAAALDRAISWVHVVDHPEIDRWLLEGQLLLSTGYHWPRDPAGAQALVERLVGKRIAGVVLAVPHYVDHYPGASIDAAERLRLPLMEIPWDTSFTAITQAVHRELVDRQGRELARSEAIHRQLTEAAVKGHGVQDVAQVLAQVLDRRVHVMSSDGQRLAAAAPTSASPNLAGAAGAPDVPAAELRAAVQARRTRTRIDAAAGPWRLPLPGAGRRLPWRLAAYAVRVRDERVGDLVVEERDDAPLTPLDLRALEHAGTVAALQIAHQRELSAQEARLGYALVAALIEGRFEATPTALERAALQGWQVDATYRLCTLLMDEPNPLTRDGLARREALAQQIRLGLERDGLRPLLSLSANQLQLLLPASQSPERWWAGFAPTSMALAVSQPHHGVDGMATAGRECAALIGHLQPGRLHRHEAMLFPRVLAGDAAARQAFVQRVLGALDDGKRGQSLLETAFALDREGFHLQRTADRLGVHISTLRYRVARLQQLSGLDLDDADGRFQLQMAARLHRLDA